MSSSDDDLGNLNDLPSDIVRKIIRQSIEIIDDIALASISPRWHVLALECLKDRRMLPTLESFCWTITHYAPTTTLSVGILRKYQKYFGLRKWKYYETNKYRNSGVCIRTIPRTMNEKRSALKLLGRCSKVERIEFAMDIQYTAETIFIKDMIRNLVIDELTLSRIRRFNEITATDTINVFRNNSAQVHLLVLIIEHTMSESSFVCFISKVTRFVSKVEIFCLDATRSSLQAPRREFWTRIEQDLNLQGVPTTVHMNMTGGKRVKITSNR